MLAFEMYLNGKKRCVAGIDEPGVLTTTLTWVLGESGGRRAGSERIGVSVSGLVSRTREFADWFQRGVERGDEIFIRVVETKAVDKPKRKRRENPADRRRHQEAYVRRMAKQFGWKLVKQ